MRYRVEKTIEIAGAHSLNLPYKSKCAKVHGHNWIVRVVCEAEALNAEGMVVDFSAIGGTVKALDHEHLNEHIEQPTAENIAAHLLKRIPHCVEVHVQESAGNVASVYA